MTSEPEAKEQLLIAVVEMEMMLIITSFFLSFLKFENFWSICR